MIYFSHTSKAIQDLEQIDSYNAKRITLKIGQYENDPHPLTRAKPLSGNWHNRFRYRIGDYRAIFKYEQNGNDYLVTILRIKHRKDVYE